LTMNRRLVSTHSTVREIRAASERPYAQRDQ
jgi:hypothetical protein